MTLAEIIDSIDLSSLSKPERNAFQLWLGERSGMQITLSNALRRGQALEAILAKKTARGIPQFTVRRLD
jgi:hypothetical protein